MFWLILARAWLLSVFGLGCKVVHVHVQYLLPQIRKFLCNIFCAEKYFASKFFVCIERAMLGKFQRKFLKMLIHNVLLLKHNRIHPFVHEAKVVKNGRVVESRMYLYMYGFCVRGYGVIAQETLGSGRQYRSLKNCLIDITEALADSLACSQSIKIIASVPDRVITIYTCSLCACC